MNKDGLPPIVVDDCSPLKIKDFAMVFQKWSDVNKGLSNEDELEW
jgi:hypothetical protein